MVYNLNGVIIRNKALTIRLDNRGLNYGDGVFETLKVLRGKILFWEDHYFRLMASMRILRMEIPMSFSPEYLEEQVALCLKEAKLEDQVARVKILVVRKAGGLYTPEQREVDFLIRAEVLDQANYELNEQGYEVELYKDFYKASGLLGNLKTTSAQLYTLAGIFKKENQLDECILLNEKKEVVEAISANLFMLKGEELITPPLSSGCLRGVMRKQVMRIAEELGLQMKEESFSPFALQKADELWLCNVINGIRWVGKYRKKEYQKEWAEKIQKRLQTESVLS